MLLQESFKNLLKNPSLIKMSWNLPIFDKNESKFAYLKKMSKFA